MAIRETRVPKCVVRVELDCLPEVFNCLGKSFLTPFVPVVSPLEVQSVSLGAGCRFLLNLLFFPGEDIHSKCIGDSLRYVGLNREDVLKIPVVTFGPEMLILPGVHHLDRDAHEVSRFSDAALEDCPC